MCMGINEISALDVINKLSEKNLKSVIKILGEEKDAFKIAKTLSSIAVLKKLSTRQI